MISQSPDVADKKQALQDAEYEIPYHYRDVFAPGQEIERTMLFEGVFNLLQVDSHARILDFGCGDGRFCFFAKKKSTVVGCDVSEAAIHWARAFNPDVTFVTGVASPVETEQFDGIVSLEVIEHISDERLRSIIPQLHALLKTGKRLVITVPSVNVPLHDKHYKHYTESLLHELLDSHFEVTVRGSTRTHSGYHKVMRLLNMISLLFYSPRFAQNHAKLVDRITAFKRSIWQQYIQWGDPVECNRLVAVCIKR